MTFRLFASGDNSHKQLLHQGVRATGIFLECISAIFNPSDISQIAGTTHLAVLCKNGAVYISGEGFVAPGHSFHSIYATPNAIYGIDDSNQVLDVKTEEFFLEGANAVAFSASSTIRALISASGECVAKIGDQIELVAEGAVAVGCTANAVFVATSNCVIEKTADGVRELEAPESIVKIECNDYESFFLGRSGKLFKLFEGVMIRIQGLPEVVAVSVGVQHYGAIAADGRLFVWGFNPSGQLGVDSDRSVFVPICVLEEVHQVACGVYNTWAVTGPGLPLVPPGIDTSVVKPARGKEPLRTDIPIAERLSL
jgi:hypothetical protein